MLKHTIAIQKDYIITLLLQQQKTCLSLSEHIATNCSKDFCFTSSTCFLNPSTLSMSILYLYIFRYISRKSLFIQPCAYFQIWPTAQVYHQTPRRTSNIKNKQASIQTDHATQQSAEFISQQGFCSLFKSFHLWRLPISLSQSISGCI